MKKVKGRKEETVGGWRKKWKEGKKETVGMKENNGRGEKKVWGKNKESGRKEGRNGKMKKVMTERRDTWMKNWIKREMTGLTGKR